MAYRERLTKTQVWEFSSLDAATQRTFVDVVQGNAGTPIVLAHPFVQVRSSSLWAAFLSAGVLLILILIASIPAWGSLEPRAHLDVWLVPFVLGGAAAAVGIAGMLQRRLVLRALPFPPGVYVLPTQLLDARRSVVRLRPLTDLHQDPERAVSSEKGQVVLSFSDGESFAFSDDNTPEEVRRQLDGLRQRTTMAEAEGNTEDLRILQPFPHGDFGTSEDVSVLSEKSSRLGGRWWLVAAGALGCVLGVGLRETREMISEGRAIAHARTSRDADGLWRYVANSGRLQGRADSALLALAMQDRDSAALLRYLKRGREVAEADRRLFERASKDGSVVALEMYLTAGKDHRSEAERMLLDLARRSNLRSDYERYLAVAHSDAELVRKKLLPEADIASAKDGEAVLALRHYLDEDVAPEVKQAIRARVDKLYTKELNHYDKLAGQAKGRELVVKMLDRLAAGKPVSIVVKGSTAPELDRHIEAFMKRNLDAVSPKRVLAQTPKNDASFRLSATHGLHRVFDEHVVPVVAEHQDPAALLKIRYCVAATDEKWMLVGTNKLFLSLRLDIEVELRVPGIERRLEAKMTFEADRIVYRRYSGRTPYTRMFENAGTLLESEIERLVRE